MNSLNEDTYIINVLDPFDMKSTEIKRSVLTDMKPIPLEPLDPKYFSRSCLVLGAQFEVHKEPFEVPDKKGFEEIIQSMLATIEPRRTIPRQLAMVFGSENLQKYLEVKNGRLFQGSHLLANFVFPVPTLLVPEKEAISPIRRTFPKPHIEENCVDVPVGTHVVHIETREAPDVVRAPQKSHAALMRSDVQNDPDLISSRLLTLPEKKSLARISERFDLINGPLFLLEYKSAARKSRAMDVQPFIDVVYNPSCVFKRERFEDIKINIDFSEPQVDVTFDGGDEKFIKELFRCHDFQVIGIFKQSQFTTYRIVGFLRHLQSDNDRRWYIEKICSANEIEAVDVRRHFPTWVQPSKALREIVLRGLHKAELKKVTEIESKHFLVTFDRIEDGKMALDDMFMGEMFGSFITRDEFCALRAKVTPTVRYSFSIQRNIRGTFNREIHRFDTKIRHHYAKTDMGALLRVFEEWHGDDELGLIGVEGWPFYAVIDELKRLEDLFQPVEVLEPGELLHGIGEAYVRSVADRYEVLVDVDKFEEKIRVFGSGSKEAVLEMKRFTKSKIFVTVDIPLDLFNLTEMLHTLPNLGACLGASCQLSGDTIKFKGTVESYEMLLEGLGRLSQALFKSCLAGLRTSIATSCPVCFARSLDNRDFFRPRCGHIMCRECCNAKIKEALKASRVEVTCDNEECYRIWTPDDFMTVILGDNRRIKWLDSEKLGIFQMAVQRAILATDGALAPCRMPDCEGILSLGSKKCSEKNCEFMCCGECFEEMHRGKTCEQVRRVLDPAVQAFIGSQGTGENRAMQCPNCKNVVQKYGGCEHMECICGTHFCFVCGYMASNGSDCQIHIQTHFKGRNFW